MLLLRMFYRIFVTCFLGLTFGSCTSSESNPQDFQAFYNRFLADSLYQMAHIQFPLEGIPNNASRIEQTGPFRWEKANWRMHRSFNPDSTGFQSTFTTFGDDIVIEQIIHESGDYGMERRFTLREDGWYLIYYAGLNSVQRQ